MQNEKYTENVGLFKAMSDVNRLIIMDMISCGEICACKILEQLNITQSTLSHHMKILCDSGLVNVRRDGKWMHYSLNETNINNFKAFLDAITRNKDDCICNTRKSGVTL